MIPLSLLSRKLKQAGANPPPLYRTIYNAALDGRLPAVHERGRWYVKDEDFAEAARVLGVGRKPKKAA